MGLFGIKFLKESEFKELREEMSMYKRQIEDVGWINFSTDPTNAMMSLIPEGFKQMLRNCKLLYYKNPLAGLWVHLTTHFVFGEGVSEPKSKDPEIQKAIKAFWNDKDNKKTISSFIAQQLISNKIQYEGNLFFVLFDDEVGNVKVRLMNVDEVEDIIMDPEDRNRPIFYKVRKIDRKFSFLSNSYSFSNKGFVYYPSVDNFNPQDYSVPAERLMDARIYHAKINCDINDKFGIPELYRGSDWVKAHKDMAGDLATLIKALSQYAFKKKVKGTATQVSALANAMNSKISLSNIKNTAGQTQVENEGIDLQAIDIKTGGVKVGTDGLRQMKLMVCAASGIFEHYFGDPSTGNLATAKTMELPMVKKFVAYQSFWTDIFVDLINYMLNKKVEAGQLTGKVIEDIKARRVIVQGEEDREIDVDFPPILESDLKEWSDAMSTAQDANLIPEDTAAEQFMLAANINNIEEELGELQAQRDRKKQEAVDKFNMENALPNDPNNPAKLNRTVPPVKKVDLKVKEAIETPKKRIDVRSEKKRNFVLQKMNGYRKVISGHFKTLLSEVKENAKASGHTGRVVGHVPGFYESLNKFVEGIREAAKEYYPIAITIGEKYMQSVLKDLKPHIKIEETLYEARGRAKTVLHERLQWNDNYLMDSLEPAMIMKFEKTIRDSYDTEDDFREALTKAVTSFEGRVEQYVGAFWTVEQNAVKEAGQGTGVMVNFVGPDDGHTCEGCDDAVNGNPYPINEAPIPGEQECLGRCRHALQVVTDDEEQI